MPPSQERHADGCWPHAIWSFYGRDPPVLAEFEPTSETQLDDTAGGIPGCSRPTMRLREVVMRSMTQASAQQRWERALKSKTRMAIEQLELQPGDLIDFWRKPSTKDESGWKGPSDSACSWPHVNYG